MEMYSSCKKLFEKKKKICKDKLVSLEHVKKIDIKVDHSYRTVKIIDDLFYDFCCNEDYVDIAKSVMVLHDYGRLYQMAETKTFCDSDSFKDIDKINDHGEYGAYLLFHEYNIKNTDVNPIYYDMFFDTIFYHSKKELPEFLSYEMNKSYFNYDAETFAKLMPNYFKSLYAQSVRDADKLDIYNQVVLGRIPSVYNNLKFGVSDIDYIVDKLKIDKNKILKLNGIDSFENVEFIKIPVNYVSLDNLKIPDFLFKQYLNNELPQISELSKQPYYNFFCAGLVRLSFLSDLNYVSSLRYIDDNNLLEKMYDIYPDEYKPIMENAFDYASSFVKKKIKSTSIYAKSVE